MKLGLKSLWMILVCSVSAYGSVQTDNVDGVSPLRYSGQLSFASPLQVPLRVTSGFGRRFHPVTARFATHNGTDFAAPLHSKVLAVQSGVVTKVGSDPISGRYLVVTHKNGWVSKYLHLSVFNVSVNQPVSKGQVIALSGTTGRTTGPHLHLELSYRGQSLDPGLVYFSPSRYVLSAQMQMVKKSREAAEPEVSQEARIIFITQKAGGPVIGVKKGKKLVLVNPGDKVFKEFRVVSNGKRYNLQKIGK